MKTDTLLKINILLLLIPFCLISCRENDLHEREALIEHREKILNQREKDFEKKKTEYQYLLKMRDSLETFHNNRLQTVWPDTLKGVWNSKLLCVASNCPNYVIGDQRNNTWQFVSDSTGSFVQIFNKDTVVRTYIGKIENNEIRLQYWQDSVKTYPIDINITLQQQSARTIRGTQIIKGNEDCEAKFSVELVKDNKK